MTDSNASRGPGAIGCATMLVGFIPMSIAIWHPVVGFSLLAGTTFVMCLRATNKERAGAIVAAGCMVAFVVWGWHHDEVEAKAKQEAEAKAVADRVRASLAPVLDQKRPTGERARAAPAAVKAIDATQSASGGKFDGVRSSLVTVVDAQKALADLEREIAELQTAAEPPKKPEHVEPVYEKPPYAGAIRIKAKFRAKYDGGWLGKDGIVVQQGDKFLVIVGAERSEFAGFFGSSEVTGYATPSGSKTTLNIGRDGREAEVWAISDQETYDDDQRHYQEALALSKRAHEEAVAKEKASYEQAQAAYREALDKYTAGSTDRTRRLDEDKAKLEVLRARLASAIDAVNATATPLLAGTH